MLAVLATGLTALTLWEKYNRDQLVSSFETMYADRLVPASEIFHMSNLLYERGRLMEEYRLHGNPGLTRENLTANGEEMDSILQAYEKTYLVQEETRHLPKYKEALSSYHRIEQHILNNSEGDYHSLNHALDNVHHELLMLADIQLTVGKQLASGHEVIRGTLSLMDTLQTGLLLMLALLVIILIQDYRSSLPKIPQGKAHLN